MGEWVEILVLVVFSILLPTVDSISDSVLGIRFFTHGRPLWAVSVLSPVVANTLLTAAVWIRREEPGAKSWTWMLVVLQVWPQYRAAKVAVLFYSRRSHAIIEKKQFERGIVSLEPFIESVPQVLILSNIYLKTSVIGTSINKAEVEEDAAIFAGTRWVFFATLSLSLFSASLGITKFFKMGPIRFLPHDKLLSTKFILALGASATFLLFKGVTLATMIYSASAAMPHLLSKHNNSLLTQMPPCSSVTMVKKYQGNWQNLRHIHLALTSHNATWTTNPVFTPPGTDWVYMFDSSSSQMVTQNINKSTESCLQDLQNCRPSIYSEGDFYCVDVTWMGALLWMVILLLPVLLINLIILIGTFRKKVISVLCLFPPLIFSGNFSLFLFGPTDPYDFWSCRNPRRKRTLSLSPGVTWANCFLSVVQASLALLLLNMMKGPVHESHDPNFQISDTNPVTMALQVMLITFLLISITLTILILHLDLLTYNSCPSELGILDGGQPDVQLIATLRGLEEVGGAIIPSQDMEMEEIHHPADRMTDHSRSSSKSAVTSQL